MSVWKRGYDPKEDEDDLTRRLLDDAGEQVRKYAPKTGSKELDGLFNTIENKLGYEINLKDAVAVPLSGLAVNIALGIGSIIFPPLALFALPASLVVSTATGALYHKRHKIHKATGKAKGGSTLAEHVDSIADTVKGKVEESGLGKRFKDYTSREK